jgi:uncharacterized Zn finger protein
VSGGRGLRGRSTIAEATPVGVTPLGARWLAALDELVLRGRSAQDHGRELAERGAVGVLAFGPGRISARVEGERGTIHPTALRVERLGLPAWRGVVETLAGSPAELAAVLDGELSEALIDAAGGVDQLVPSLAAVRPSCGCSASAVACEHVAALWHLVARELDRRPAVLLDVRGHDSDLVAAVRRRALRRAALGHRGAPDPGVESAEAFARPPAALPPAPAVPTRPGTPAPLTGPPPAGVLVTGRELTELAADAARRAWELAGGRGTGDLELDRETDLGRRAATVGDDARELIAFARATGLDAARLARLGLAWRAAGKAGVDIVLRPWSPPPAWLDPAARALELLGRVRRSQNRVECDAPQLQLRLGRDRRWYLLERDGDDWALRHPPGADPAETLRAGGIALPAAVDAPDDATVAVLPSREAGRRPSPVAVGGDEGSVQLTLW